MKGVSVAFYGLALGFLAIGLRELLTGFEENRCSMTYMFEYPEYKRVSLPRRVTRLYPAYGLYLYGEGVYAQETRNLKLSGAPVLFLPGNAGSHKQARSLGSVALRKAENVEGGLHFNVFTVDFNEELVALYGGSLLKQTHFLHESIKAILRLYKHLKSPPQSVVLASPHVAPVLGLDPYLINFYRTVRQKWLKSDHLRNVTVLSVGGGYRDFQVRSGLTSLPCSDHDPQKISLVFTEDPEKKMAVLNHHFIRHPVSPVGETQKTTASFLEAPESWSEVNTLRLAHTSPKEGQVKYFLFALSSRRKAYSHFYCRHSGLHDMTSWVYGCMQKNGSKCVNAVDLSLDTEYLPPYKFTVECEWQRQQSQSQTITLPVPHVLSLGMTVSDVTISSSGLLHTIQLQHFHQCPMVTEISGMLHTSRPDNSSSAILQLHTAPNCQYKVSVRTSLPKVLGQVLRFCGPIVPVYTAVTLLLACGRQLTLILKSKETTSMSQAVAKSFQPIKLSSLFEWPLLLSPLLYVMGAAVAFWAALCYASLSTVCLQRLWDTSFMVPAARAVCLTILGSTMCGALSISIAFLFHLYRVLRLQMTERSLSHMLNLAPQKHKKAENGRVDSESSECNGTPLLSEVVLQEVRGDLQLHLCFSVLFTVPAVLSAPSLLHWIRNMSKLLRLAYWLPLPLAVAMLSFSALHLYRITYFLLAALVPMALCCLL
ncbi:hypothetical protein WMY93_001721 [Mugilogobius chulae]|uniref:GPI inositol-deacylase PGAP1-like alpha/beta domain-containing protein n=1 Tax=Mugilogobius chulae TaxID=88201 RepID=A0AAW0PS55_9GOBI